MYFQVISQNNDVVWIVISDIGLYNKNDPM